MHPALAPPRCQSGPLQGLFHPGIAQLNPMLRTQLLVKMPYVQIEIAIPVQSQNLLHRRQRHPFGGRLPPPPVEQPVLAVRFVALVPAPHRPIADADNLGCHHVIFFAMARKITSCTFIARSTAAFE
jgi:hypothetical protein